MAAQSLQVLLTERLLVIHKGKSFKSAIENSIHNEKRRLQDHDICSVASKIISSSEGRRTDLAAITPDKETALLDETAKLGLPNFLDAVNIEQEISRNERNSLRPLSVRPPYPGRYTTRPGERLSRRALMGAVDEWLTQTDGQTRFIIQGGNRYVTFYAAEAYGLTIPDIKIMSVEKAPLSVQLQTILTAEERRSPVNEAQLHEVLPVLPPAIAAAAHSMSRADLLQIVANMTLQGPFNLDTFDESLQEDLSKVVTLIGEGIEIPGQAAITALMSGTALADALRNDESIHFLDDLFYRGRTLYSLAILITACGGDPMNMRLTTFCSDIQSAGLRSPFHTVLRSGVLYPFENSIRTEQGYWQDVGAYYVFTDMGAYWEYLHLLVDPDQSRNKYSEWQETMHKWSEQHLVDLFGNLGMSMIGPLLWLHIYCRRFEIELDTNKIIDQKGYRIGACVPFAQLIDRFISQEEPAEARRRFKDQIRSILSAIEVEAAADPDGYNPLVSMYSSDQHALDYQGLFFMTKDDVQCVAFTENESGTNPLMVGVAKTSPYRRKNQDGSLLLE